MTYQLHIKQPSTPKQIRNRFYFKVFLSLVAANILSVCFVQDVSLLIALDSLFLAIGAFLVYNYIQKTKLPYIRIQDSKLEYYCLKEKQVVTISADEITHITHRFCELRVHTKEQVHYLNLEPVRKERKRWEIKEMINQWAHA